MKVLFLGSDNKVFSQIEKICESRGLLLEMHNDLSHARHFTKYNLIVTKHRQEGLEKDTTGFDLIRNLIYKHWHLFPKGQPKIDLILITKRPSLGMRGFSGTHGIKLVPGIEDLGRCLQSR